MLRRFLSYRLKSASKPKSDTIQLLTKYTQCTRKNWTEYRPKDKDGIWATYTQYNEEDNFYNIKIQPALLASLKRAATTSISTRTINGKSYIPPLLSMTLLLNMILTSYTIHTKFQTITICCKK